MSVPRDKVNITRSAKRNQIALTDETLKAMGLKAGEYHIERAKSPRGAIILKPERRKKVKPWTEEEWRQKEKEADEAIAAGKVSGPFHSAEELIKHLDSAAQKWRKR